MKAQLFANGIELLGQFCYANNLQIPIVNCRSKSEWKFKACAYYRPVKIEICVDKCAHVGTAGRQWSYPGYTVDRTPYGVLQHELGHHVDVTMGGAKGGYMSDFSKTAREQSGEPKLTNYCPNDAEWFAEMFRLFVTNPNLLKAIRPRSYQVLRHYLVPAINQSWEEVLKEAPIRYILACFNKL